jgi:integrase
LPTDRAIHYNETAHPTAKWTERHLIRARNKPRSQKTPEKEQLLLTKGLVGQRAHLLPLVRFALDTGLRLGEITRLQVEHVNLDKESRWFEINGESIEVPVGCFIVTRSKNGKPRVIPMNARARAVAAHQLNDATITKYLFPSSKTDGMIKEVKKGLAGAWRELHTANTLRTALPFTLSVTGLPRGWKIWV